MRKKDPRKTGGRSRKEWSAGALSAKQHRFFVEFLACDNATEAARRADYKHAEVVGPRLLGHPAIAAKVKAAQGRAAAKAGITKERVLRELELLSFSDAASHYRADENGNVSLADGAPEGALRAIASIKRRWSTVGSGDSAITTCDVEIKLWDKVAPLKIAGRHVEVKGFYDRVEHTGEDGGPIQTSIVEYRIPGNGR